MTEFKPFRVMITKKKLRKIGEAIYEEQLHIDMTEEEKAIKGLARIVEDELKRK